MLGLFTDDFSSGTALAGDFGGDWGGKSGCPFASPDVRAESTDHGFPRTDARRMLVFFTVDFCSGTALAGDGGGDNWSLRLTAPPVTPFGVDDSGAGK